MPDHIKKMINIHHWIVKEKSTMDDIILAYTIFCSLPNNNVKWNVLKISLIEKELNLTLSQATMSLNDLYNCMTQNKEKTEHLALVAKLQRAFNYRNTVGKKKKFKEKTLNPKPDNICYIYGQKGH